MSQKILPAKFYTVCNIVLSPFCEYLRQIVFKVKNANFNAFENSHNIFTTVHTVFSSTHKFFICCVKNLARSWNCLCRVQTHIEVEMLPGARRQGRCRVGSSPGQLEITKGNLLTTHLSFIFLK